MPDTKLPPALRAYLDEVTTTLALKFPDLFYVLSIGVYEKPETGTLSFELHSNVEPLDLPALFNQMARMTARPPDERHEMPATQTKQ